MIHADVAPVSTCDWVKGVLSAADRSSLPQQLRFDFGFYAFDTFVDYLRRRSSKRVPVDSYTHHALSLAIICGYMVR
jgi:hypothetical protein